MGSVVVETFREGALLVATARSGGSDEAPFAFERAADGRFVVSLCDMVVVVAGANVHVEWAGSLEALVLRQGEVLHRTVPRALGITAPGREPRTDLAGPWAVEPGDLVLLCSAKVRQVLSEGDLSALASREDLAAIVRGLVTTASTRGDFHELFAAAIRIAS